MEGDLMSDLGTLAFLKGEKLASQMASIQSLITVTHAANVFTIDLNNAAIKNFKIVSADANAKSIIFSNKNASASLITVSVDLVCTTACAITHPTGTTFASGTPSFTTGQSYWLAYDSIDGGTTWAGYSVRRT